MCDACYKVMVGGSSFVFALALVTAGAHAEQLLRSKQTGDFSGSRRGDLLKRAIMSLQNVDVDSSKWASEKHEVRLPFAGLLGNRPSRRNRIKLSKRSVMSRKNTSQPEERGEFGSLSRLRRVCFGRER